MTAYNFGNNYGTLRYILGNIEEKNKENVVTTFGFIQAQVIQNQVRDRSHGVHYDTV